MSKVMLFAKVLPPEVRTKLQAAMTQHVEFVVTQDWPAMAAMRASQRTEPVALLSAMATLLSFAPTQADQKLAQQSAVAAVEQAFVARRSRIRLSQIEIAATQWSVIAILAMLILVTIAFVHMEKPAVLAATLLIFSTAVAASLVLLMENDRPFASGGISLTPAAFRDIILN